MEFFSWQWFFESPAFFSGWNMGLLSNDWWDAREIFLALEKMKRDLCCHDFLRERHLLLQMQSCWFIATPNVSFSSLSVAASNAAFCQFPAIICLAATILPGMPGLASQCSAVHLKLQLWMRNGIIGIQNMMQMDMFLHHDAFFGFYRRFLFGLPVLVFFFEAQQSDSLFPSISISSNEMGHARPVNCRFQGSSDVKFHGHEEEGLRFCWYNSLSDIFGPFL